MAAPGSANPNTGCNTEAQRNKVLRKIEFLYIDLIKQLTSSKLPPRLILRASSDDADKQILITPARGGRCAYVVQCLAQIYRLLSNGQQSTKRDLFYEHKSLYKIQSNLDRTITSICDLLDEPRQTLNIISSSKGVLSGALTFMTEEQRLVDCRNQQVMITESLTNFRLISNAEFILVVEKDAIFQKMIDEGYFDVFPRSLLVTARGYPDICTRQVLRWLIGKLAIPIYGLFDSDPHGIEIMLIYKYGGIAESREGRGSHVKQLQWLGFKPSHASVLPIDGHQFLALRNRDFVKITKIRRRAESLGEEDVVQELDLLRSIRSKLELEAVSSVAPKFIIQVYLASRLASLLPSSCRPLPHPALDAGREESDNAGRRGCLKT